MISIRPHISGKVPLSATPAAKLVSARSVHLSLGVCELCFRNPMQKYADGSYISA